MAPTATIARLLGIAALAYPLSLAFGQCEVAKLTDADGGSNDLFGKRIQLRNSELLFGVPGHDGVATNSGSAYLYALEAPSWTWAATLLPPDGGGNGSGFARAVALEDDTLLCTSTQRARGYVYEWNDVAGWLYTADVMASDYNPEDAFGETADMDGETIVIGAPWDNNANGGDAGSVYVFDREPSGEWVQTQKLLASDGQSNAEFGVALAIDGDVIVVGASEQWVGGVPYAGKAYVFERNPQSGMWMETAALLPPVSHSLQNYGLAVAIHGSMAFVGAEGDYSAGDAAGAVFTYRMASQRVWLYSQTLTADDPQTAQSFGRDVSVAGDVLLIGANDDDNPGTSEGAAYLFIRESDDVWRQHAKFTASDGAYYDRFGYSVALDGSWAVIGAPYDDDNGTDSGSAYIFRVGPDWSGNGVPDICECPGDIDYSGAVGLSDLSALLTNFGLAAGQSYESGDIDGDYDVDLADLSALLERYGTACP